MKKLIICITATNSIHAARIEDAMRQFVEAATHGRPSDVEADDLRVALASAGARIHDTSIVSATQQRPPRRAS